MDFSNFSLSDLKNKKIIIYLSAAVLGIILVIFSGNLVKNNESHNQTESSGYNDNLEQYSENLEKRLYSLISSIEGVGETELMITLENDTEYIYADEEKKTFDKSEETDDSVVEKENIEKNLILIDGENGKEALLKTAIEPKVRGIVVVCEGGDSPTVQQRVTDALKAALDIQSDKICVTKLS